MYFYLWNVKLYGKDFPSLCVYQPSKTNTQGSTKVNPNPELHPTFSTDHHHAVRFGALMP